jgi:peptidoglycan/xylan/chitin deacetylase (PgdA/CDA1 family)
MFFHHELRGSSLPPRTVCLTYDDGPGEHTEELARFLFERGITATFFVIGKHAALYPDVMARLCAWGHVVGNHTYNHPGLVDLAVSGGDVVGEVATADEIIKSYVSRERVFLRPPYGSWRQQTRPNGPQDFATSIVADALNGSGRFTNYVGPISWDIVAEDWHSWREGISPDECARKYLAATEEAGRGIILLHDSSEEEDQRPKNRTMEMTKLLVPLLSAHGYRFACLDDVPEISALSHCEGDPACSKVWMSLGNGGQATG